MAPERPALDTEGLLRVLLRHGVAFVVIGGAAGVGHGSHTATFDLDLTPGLGRDNLARLAAALTELGAQLRIPGLDEPLAVRWSADTFTSFATVATRTPLGDLDLVLRPDGLPADAYAHLEPRAEHLELGDLVVAVAAVEDVIASKRAAARRTGLPRYEASADELQRLLDEPGR